MYFFKLILNKVRYYYPFTINGTILLLLSLILLGIAFGSWNLYALFFSVLSLFFLIFLMIIGIILKLKNLDETLTIELIKPVIARLQNQHLKILCSIEFFPLFFRIHYTIKGKFKVGRKCNYFAYFENSIRPGNNRELLIPVYFPFCGMGYFKGYSSIRDIFNLICIQFKSPEDIKLWVLPPLFPEKPQVRILPSTTQESLRNIQTSDEEKYFMREYIPGDRLKDINWKSSIKLNELITRISPSSPEESHLIYIEIRPYHYSRDKDGINAILQLNYLKSWVLSFLNIMKKEHPNYKFHIFTGKESFFVDSEEEIIHLAKKLVEIEFMAQQINIEQPITSEKFVFSTGFDKKINQYLNNHKSTIYLFRTVFGTNRKVPFFYPGFFNLLPGLWIFRKENPDRNSPRPFKGKLMEEKIKIHFI
jgi:uncharacterized protein (DUF58 family)